MVDPSVSQFLVLAPRLLGCSVEEIEVAGPFVETIFPGKSKEVSEIALSFSEFQLLFRWEITLRGEYLAFYSSNSFFQLESESFSHEFRSAAGYNKTIVGVRYADYDSDGQGDLLLWSVVLIFDNGTCLGICLGEFQDLITLKHSDDCLVVTTLPALLKNFSLAISGGSAWGKLLCGEDL